MKLNPLLPTKTKTVFVILLLVLCFLTSCKNLISNEEIIEKAREDNKNERINKILSIIDTISPLATNCDDSILFTPEEYNIEIWPKINKPFFKSITPKRACIHYSVSDSTGHILSDLMKEFTSGILIRRDRISFSFKRLDNFTANKQYKIIFYKTPINFRERYKDFEITSGDTIPESDKWIYILNDTTIVYRKPKN